jgi:CBS domain containing-hemolysin-like protein
MGIFEIGILLLLIGSSLLVNFKTAIARVGMIETENEFQRYPYYYGFLIWIRKIQPNLGWEQFIDFIGIYIQIYRLLFTLFAAFELFLTLGVTATFFHLWIICLIVLGLMLVLEVTMRIFAIAFPFYSIKFFGFLSGFLMVILLPIIYPMILIQHLFSSKHESKNHKLPLIKFKTKLQEFIHHLDLNESISAQEKKLLMAIANFRDRIAREIMVPRIEVFSLSSKKSVVECAKEFIKEGYSRIPVYEETVDNIIGVILSKDILDYLSKSLADPSSFPIDKSIKSLLKPVLFTPETKKIANLLQEFKSSQIHLAIVVDEYGGTEGIVTIEDILEELVGEIEDEYDIEEPHPFQKDPSGGYIIDAKTTLFEIENELGISIPQTGTYDTIGGFIVNVSGSIPKKGWKVHYDSFYLEILSGDEKSLDKIKIVPTFRSN